MPHIHMSHLSRPNLLSSAAPLVSGPTKVRESLSSNRLNLWMMHIDSDLVTYCQDQQKKFRKIQKHKSNNLFHF